MGVRPFEKATGPTGLKKHSNVNVKMKNVIVELGNMENSYKSKLRDAAARYVVLDTLLFTFTTKTGMVDFTKSYVRG